MFSPHENHRLVEILDSIEILAEEKNILEAMGKVCCKASESFGASLVTVLAFSIDSQTGYLVSSNLKPGLSPKPLDPVILLDSEVDIQNNCFHKSTDENKPLFSLISGVMEIPEINSFSMIGFSLGRRLRGVLVIGLTEVNSSSQTLESDNNAQDKFIFTYGSLFKLLLQYNPILDRMKEQTHRMRPVTPAKTLSTDMLLRYREFFESLSGGTFIVDSKGKVVFLNHEAEVMTGYSSDWLIGRRVLEVVVPSHRDGFVQVLERTLTGENLKSFDIDLETTSGDIICVNMGVALLSGDTPLVALTFKDITETRVVEQELLKTKEFFERIIQSTVDAIVCADNTGLLTLFNVGAERLFGYSAENVVNQITLNDLFAGQDGINVMQNLHSPKRGGEGRLEPIRVEVMARDGERVPVQLTASTIYDEGIGVGIVLIMTDLRERLRMERRYQEIQDQYLNSQKQALVAELAGTTAHELNQPLTSIMGYAEILDRRIEKDSPNRRAVETIMSEADRMAEIVKKIGKITRYETKNYVGSTQILDLDKSSD